MWQMCGVGNENVWETYRSQKKIQITFHYVGGAWLIDFSPRLSSRWLQPVYLEGNVKCLDRKSSSLSPPQPRQLFKYGYLKEENRWNKPAQQQRQQPSSNPILKGEWFSSFSVLTRGASSPMGIVQLLPCFNRWRSSSRVGIVQF
jgi:hypothetical protein